MSYYIILSRVSPDAFSEPKAFKELAEKVSKKIKEECPEVKWKESFVTMGRFDVVDIIEAPDAKQAERASMVIRAYGHSSTETLPATDWKDFLSGL